MGLISHSAIFVLTFFCFLEFVSWAKPLICNICEAKRTLQNYGAHKFIRINTCKSVTKQTTLTPFRMNTYAKPRGGLGIGGVRTGRMADRMDRAYP